MNNVVPVAAVGAASVLVNRWVQRHEVPVLGAAAGLSNRAIGATAGTGLRAIGAVTQGVGIAVVGFGTLARNLASIIDGATAPPQRIAERADD